MFWVWCFVFCGCINPPPFSEFLVEDTGYCRHTKQQGKAVGFQYLNVRECLGNVQSRERGTSQDTCLLLCILTFIEELGKHCIPVFVAIMSCAKGSRCCLTKAVPELSQAKLPLFLFLFSAVYRKSL